MNPARKTAAKAAVAARRKTLEKDSPTVPAYILKSDGRDRYIDLPFEDALAASRELALLLGCKVFVHRAADGAKLAASGIFGKGGVTPRDVGNALPTSWKKFEGE